MSAFDILRDDMLDHLLGNGQVTPEAIGRARTLSDRTGQPVEQVLNQLGLLSDIDLAQAYADVSGLPVWLPDQEPVQIDYRDFGLGQEFLRKVRVVPLRLDDERLLCAACDPFDEDMKAGLAFATGRDVVLCVSRLSDWRHVFGAGGGGGGFPSGIGGSGGKGANGGGNGSDGGNGTTSGGGAGGAGASSPGTTSPGSPGGGAGSSGYAIRKNGNSVPVTNNGTISGGQG